jgi:hypothetical protein
VQVVAWVFISPIIAILWVWSGTRWPSFGKIAATAAILTISIVAAAAGSGRGSSTSTSTTPNRTSTPTTTAPSTVAPGASSAPSPSGSQPSGTLSNAQSWTLRQHLNRVGNAYGGFGLGVQRCIQPTGRSVPALTQCLDVMYHRQGIHEKTVDAKREIESAQGSVSGPCRSTLEHVQSILTKADALFFKAHNDFQASL